LQQPATPTPWYTGFVHIFDLHFILIQDKPNACRGQKKGKKKEKERLLV
jgi:hypothetical protein